MSGPAGDWCPKCGLYWHVHGCEPGKCKAPRVNDYVMRAFPLSQIDPGRDEGTHIRVIPPDNATFAERKKARQIERFYNSPEMAVRVNEAVEQAERSWINEMIYGPDRATWPN